MQWQWCESDYNDAGTRITRRTWRNVIVKPMAATHWHYARACELIGHASPWHAVAIDDAGKPVANITRPQPNADEVQAELTRLHAGNWRRYLRRVY